MATQFLLRLHHFTGKEEYRERPKKFCARITTRWKANPLVLPICFARWIFIYESQRNCDQSESGTIQRQRNCSQSIHSLYLPNMTLQLAGPEESLETISPLLQGKTQIDGKPTVYVCHNFTCSAPVTTGRIEDLAGKLMSSSSNCSHR